MSYNLEQYEPFIQAAAKKYGVSPDQIRGIIKKESSGNPNAQNGSHYGLMQMSPNAFKEAGVTDRSMYKDPQTNIDAGANYLSQRIKANGGDPLKGGAAYIVGDTGLKQMMNGERSWDKQVEKYLSDPVFNNVWDSGTALQTLGYKAPDGTTPNPVPGQPTLNRVAGVQTQNVPQDDASYTLQGQPMTAEQQKAYLDERVREMMMNQQAQQAVPEYYGVDPVESTEDPSQKWKDGAYALASVLFGNRDNKSEESVTRLGSGGASGWSVNAQQVIQNGKRFGTGLYSNQLKGGS